MHDMTAHIRQSRKFNTTHRIPPYEKIQWGYMDGGRNMQFNEDGSPQIAPSREILIVRSPAQDNMLAQVMSIVQHDTEHMDTVSKKAVYLAKKVHELMNESSPANIKSIMNGQIKMFLLLVFLLKLQIL